MLTLLLKELDYLKWALISWLIALSLLLFYNQIGDSDSTGIMPFMPLMFSTLYSMRGKEKRDRLIALLPVSRTVGGWLRLSLLIAPFMIFFFLVFLFKLFIPLMANVNLDFVLGFMDGLLVVISLFFILNDYVTRKKREPLKATAVVAVAVGGIVFVLGIVGYAVQGQETAFAKAIDGFITGVIKHPVFHGPMAILRFTLFALLMTPLTVWSYRHRVSMTE